MRTFNKNFQITNFKQSKFGVVADLLDENGELMLSQTSINILSQQLNDAWVFKASKPTTIRVTSKQNDFLDSLYERPYSRLDWYESYDDELRIAMGCYKKGLIEFRDGEVPEKDCGCFEARLTDLYFDVYLSVRHDC